LRQVVYKAVRELSNMPLMGYELILKGKLMAKGGRKQKHRISEGYLKKVGNQVSLVKKATGTAYTKAGAIGITLSLISPNTIFPDKISKEDIKTSADRVFRGIVKEPLVKTIIEAKEENKIQKQSVDKQ
jgi:ribosomal protein S3